MTERINKVSNITKRIQEWKCSLVRRSKSDKIFHVLNIEENFDSKVLSENECVVWRICFIRHGKSQSEGNEEPREKKTKSWAYNKKLGNKPKIPQSENTPLNQEWIDNIKEAARRIKPDVFKSKKLVFIYWNKTERVNQSLFYLLQEIYIPQEQHKDYKKEDFETFLKTISEQHKNVNIRSDDNFETTEVQYAKNENWEIIPRELHNAECTAYNKQQQSATAFWISDLSEDRKSVV